MDDKSFVLLEKMYAEMQNGFNKINTELQEVKNTIEKIDSRLVKVESTLENPLKNIWIANHFMNPVYSEI